MNEDIPAGFTTLDWTIVASVLIGTTLLAARLAKEQTTLKDFFLGGRRLPWFAVSASIIATEISTVTFISLPFVVFQEGGNLTYLQLGLIGSFIARCIVGYVLVPAYYRASKNGDIYSPYDYMGHRLGERVRQLMSLLFGLGGILGQAARVYLTALVLEVLLHRELGVLAHDWGVDTTALSMTFIGMLSIVWTLLGGIATVVWTDALLFLLFIVGVTVSLLTLHQQLDGGLPEALLQGAEAGKLVLWDFDTDPTKAFTFWAALFAITWSGIGSYGTDHMLAQRLLCCRDEGEARKAIIVSIVGMAITFAVALIGVGLWAYYTAHPLTGESARLVAEKGDRIYPLFISEVIPPGFRGLVLAGAFAAAISSLDSILAALSQTTLSALVLPWRQARLDRQEHNSTREEDERFALKASRYLVVFWGVALVLCALGIESAAAYYDSILSLALAMATYTAGGLIAGFFLAFTNKRIHADGLLWSAPLSMLMVFALVWHHSTAIVWIWALLGLGAIAWLLIRLKPAVQNGALTTEALPTLWYLAIGGLIVWTGMNGYWTNPDGSFRNLAWPWYVPIGSLIALGGAMLLSTTKVNNVESVFRPPR